MAVHITPLPHVAFTMLRNCWLRDRRISLKAKGLLGYLRSHAEGYAVSQSQMITDSDDGRAAVRSALDELEAAGYLHRTPTRSAGRFAEDDYALSDPFDLAGNLLGAPGAETAPLPEAAGAETSQRRFSASDNPHRIIAPLEDQEIEDQTTLLPLPPPGGGARQAPAADLFDEFWSAYPKKVGKDAARRAWAKAVKRDDAGKIIDVAQRYPWHRDRQFVKDPATWLNKGCWMDDLDAAAASNGNGNGRAAGVAHPHPPRDAYSVGDGRF